MGNKESSAHPHRIKESSSSRRSSMAAMRRESQSQIQPPPSPPRYLPPTVMMALPDPEHTLDMIPTISHSPERPPNVLTPEEDFTIPDSPNSIMASAIPEVYYASDMIHIDSFEPAPPIDLSVPSYVSATGEISQAYPEPDPYINNYVELYGIPPAPPLDDPNGIRGDLPFRSILVILLSSYSPRLILSYSQLSPSLLLQDPNFRDSFVTVGGIKLKQPRKKLWIIPSHDELIYSFSNQSNNWF